jgi:hypothetical protein
MNLLLPSVDTWTNSGSHHLTHGQIQGTWIRPTGTFKACQLQSSIAMKKQLFILIRHSGQMDSAFRAQTISQGHPMIKMLFVKAHFT